VSASPGQRGTEL